VGVKGEEKMLKKLFAPVVKLLEWIAEGQKKQPVCKS
jgi:hypothetical protein